VKYMIDTILDIAAISILATLVGFLLYIFCIPFIDLLGHKQFFLGAAIVVVGASLVFWAMYRVTVMFG
jgi:hypothetical protein